MIKGDYCFYFKEFLKLKLAQNTIFSKIVVTNVRENMKIVIYVLHEISNV